MEFNLSDLNIEEIEEKQEFYAWFDICEKCNSELVAIPNEHNMKYCQKCNVIYFLEWEDV